MGTKFSFDFYRIDKDTELTVLSDVNGIDGYFLNGEKIKILIERDEQGPFRKSEFG